MTFWLRLVYSTLIAVPLSFALFLSYSEADKESKDWDLQKREEMVRMSRQLGVTCTHCHDVTNLRKTDKPPYKIALDHIRITTLLNQEGFKGKPKVDCFLCHRGAAKPPYHE